MCEYRWDENHKTKFCLWFEREGAEGEVLLGFDGRWEIICSKTLVKNLLTLLEQVEDDKKEFKLIYSSNKLNKFLI